MTRSSLYRFKWIDKRFPPSQHNKRYRCAYGYGMDDFGNAVLLVPNNLPYSRLY